MVQGQGAAEQVARGVEFFNRTGGADVIVVTRGGGAAWRTSGPSTRSGLPAPSPRAPFR